MDGCVTKLIVKLKEMQDEYDKSVKAGEGLYFKRDRYGHWYPDFDMRRALWRRMDAIQHQIDRRRGVSDGCEG